jgi:predicted ATPase
MNLQIKSLVVQECGPLRDVEISFTNSEGTPRPVTVIGGANGSGKTTILELIFAFMQILSDKVPPSRLRPPILKRTREAKLNLLLESEDLSIHFDRGPTGTPGYGYSKPLATIPLLQDAIRSGYSNSLLPFDVAKSSKQTAPGLSDEAEANHKVEFAPSILYFPYYRRIVPLQSTGLSREDANYQWTYRYEVVQSFQGSLNAYLVWLEYAQVDTFEEVKRFLNETVLVDKTIAHVERSKLQTMVELSANVIHPLEELSSGEQNLLIIMLELWRRLLPGSIVLVDEIENSLHPAFQHRLAEALLKLQARIPFQLIVTTHAPAFLDAFGTDSALILTEF